MNARWRCHPMKNRRSRFQSIIERAQTITLKTDLEKILGTRPFYPHWVYTCLYCYLLLNSFSKQFSKQLLYNSAAIVSTNIVHLSRKKSHAKVKVQFLTELTAKKETFCPQDFYPKTSWRQFIKWKAEKSILKKIEREQ